MKKFFYFSLVIIAGLLIFWFMQIFVYKQIVNACLEVGAEALNIQIEASGYFNTIDNYELSKQLIKGFDIYAYDYTQIDDALILNASIKDGIITIKVKDIDDKTYASIIVSQNAHTMNINNIKQTIFKNFLLKRAYPKFSILVQGKFEGKMASQQMKQVALNIINSKRAIFVDGIEEDNLVSVSAFLPTLEERKKCNNSFVNLNIALRYSSINDCTYIWVGSPLIFVEY